MQELIDFVGTGGFDSPECVIRIMVIVIVCSCISNIVKNLLSGVRA